MPSKTTAITAPPATAGDLALQQWSPAELEVVRATIAPRCTDAELALFAGYCKRTGLDPFSRQVYAIKRRQWDAEVGEKVEKLTIQTSIDGLRLIAERTRHYRGQRPMQWCGEDGAWTEVWLSDKPPAAARASVLRADFDEPMTAVALFSEYAQSTQRGLTEMWKSKPVGMLAKCAEALALRKAFPNDMSGLYIDEELAEETAEDRVRAALAQVRRGDPTPPVTPLPVAQEFIPKADPVGEDYVEAAEARQRGQAAPRSAEPSAEAPAPAEAPSAPPAAADDDPEAETREKFKALLQTLEPSQRAAWYAHSKLVPLAPKHIANMSAGALLGLTSNLERWKAANAAPAEVAG